MMKLLDISKKYGEITHKYPFEPYKVAENFRGKPAWRAEGDTERSFFRLDAQWRHAEEFNGLHNFLKAGASFLADTEAAK